MNARNPLICRFAPNHLTRYRFFPFTFLVLVFISLFQFFPIHSAFSTLINSRNISYYGEDFYHLLAQQETTYKANANNELGVMITSALNKILNNYHMTQQGDYDQIVVRCQIGETSKAGQRCYNHKVLSYNEARKIVFTQIDLKIDQTGHYFVEDVYCHNHMTDFEYPESIGPDANQLPDANIINIEHTWPQSYFIGSARYPRIMQKTDLHHLFPTMSQVNGLRSHYPFANVIQPYKNQSCGSSTLGYTVAGNTRGADRSLYFQPPASHRGNVARAMFYFAVKYERKISTTEEAALRRWEQEDPVDESEKIRNEKIYRLQGTRNPFIDFPELSKMVSDF